ncbi:RNA polymerase sigma factor [Frateuria sp. YIM B11624]|uniref:RNA polymerase sigma factor n=1 Tax=Frateuria sp. YIM B11624 TaxID=3143185 RepID=UPI003C73384F
MPAHPLDDALRDLLPRLRRFALWLTRDLSSADDLVQATLERALSRWSSRREEASLRSWLFAILYRQFLDGRRRAQRHAWLLGRLRTEEDEPQAPSAEREAVAQAMLQAFGRLNPEQRSLLLWVTVEGLSYQEVAQILDVPIGTVMSRLSRARAALRRLGEGETTHPSLRVLK